MRNLLPIAFLLSALTATPADFKAGVARVVITPKVPIRMSGYAVRTLPSEGVAQDIWAKALALEDQQGNKTVFVTLDLLVVPRKMAADIAAAVRQKHHLERDRFVLSASHTHAGPEVRTDPIGLPDSPEEAEVVKQYAAATTQTIIDLIGSALADLKPATLGFARTSAGFAINRRLPADGKMTLSTNPNGPTDHEVPVIVVRGANNRPRAIVFGYACHNTTSVGDFRRISGDYAGFAQLEIEKSFPGSTAMFIALCGGDQNPNPRGKIELAEQHGKELGEAVTKAASGKLATLHGPVRTAFETTRLGFAPIDRDTFEKRVAESKDAYVLRHAKVMLETYEANRPIRSVDYPVQAIRFGRDLTMIILGGEVVVDYSLRTKRELTGEPLIVAAYSNDVMSYIPSKRILREGGYEAESSMLYYGLPGAYAEDVEDKVFAAIHDVARRVGRE